MEKTMDLPRLSRRVKRITVLTQDENGNTVPVVIFDKKRKKKKSTKALKPLESFARGVVDASNVTASAYLSRHKKANRKRRDGWVRDLNHNVIDAGRKGMKKLDPTRLIKP
jgi:hypothetical protein